MSKKAKLFKNGRSQAVRLPAEFKFSGVDEVYVRHDEQTGDVVLSEQPLFSWADYFILQGDTESLSDSEREAIENFMAERQQDPLPDRGLF